MATWPSAHCARGPVSYMNYFAYKDNRLFAEEVAISDLAARFGTPLYVYSTRTLRRLSDALKIVQQSLNSPAGPTTPRST